MRAARCSSARRGARPAPAPRAWPTSRTRHRAGASGAATRRCSASTAISSGRRRRGAYQQGIDERYWGRDPDAAQGFFTTPTSQPSASASYTVRAGETLASIAAQTWGDASLWYVIAEANGLSGSGQVAPGQTLIIPNKAVRTHYNADTFRPYDGSELVGPTGASKPHVNRNKGDCGVLGVVIKMLVTIAVLSIMPTATSFLQGALFGGVANVAAQGVGMMTGIQDGFNWKELGTSAVSGGVAGELSGVKLFDKLGAFSEVGRQAAGGAISQGIAVATGLQDKMDWAGVAMAGVMGGVSGLIKGGNLLGSLKGTLFGDGVANMAGALAAAGAKHIIDGSSFGDNLKSLLPSVVGQTIGDAIARSRAADRVKQRAERRAQSAAELIRASKYPFEVTTDGAGSVMNVMKDGMPVRRTDVGAGSGMIDLGAEPDVVIGGENYAWRYTDGVDLSSGQKVSTGHNASSIVYVSDGSASGTLSSHGWGNPENNTIIHSLTNDVGQSYLWVDNADIAMGATASIPALGLSIWRTTAGSGYYEAQYASQVLGERLDDIDRAYAAGVGNHWALPYMSQPARNDFYAANIRSQPFRDHWSTKVMSAPAVLASGALGGEAEIFGYLAVGARSLMAGRTAGVVAAEGATGGLRTSALVSPARVEAFLVKNGLSAETATGFVDSFDGSITARLVRPGEDFVRYFDEPFSTGNFLGKTKFSSPSEAVDALALQGFSNKATSVQPVTSTGRTIVFEGAIKGGAPGVNQTIIYNQGAFFFGPGAGY